MAAVSQMMAAQIMVTATMPDGVAGATQMPARLAMSAQKADLRATVVDCAAMTEAMMSRSAVLGLALKETRRRQTAAQAFVIIVVVTMSAEIGPPEIALPDPIVHAAAFPRPGRAAVALRAIMPAALVSAAAMPAVIILAGPLGGAAVPRAGLAAVTAAKHLLI